MRLSKESYLRKVLGVLRFIVARLWHVRTFSSHGVSLFDAGTSVFILQGGRLEAGHRVVLGRRAELQARGGNLSIGTGTAIGSYSRIIAFDQITIGKRCAIAQFVSVLDHNHAFGANGRMNGYDTAPIKIGDDVWIGDKVTIVSGVTIGDGARIAAGAVVTRNIPAGSLAGGIPAKVLSKRVE